MAAAFFRAATSSAFDKLYERHVASVYRYAFAVVGNRADAEDITQQTFLNAYRAMAQGTKPRKAENWLLTIAHNEVRRHFRDNKKKSHEVEFDEELALPAPEPERSEPGVADVLRALRELVPAQRSALVMREFEGRSYKEIAQIMGLSDRALEALIFRARRSLAEQLEGALTCGEAEEAVMRRLDGRLSRREARRLRRHVKDCLRCARFGRVQKQQRSLLKGLSVMPVPASIFLFRGESAAAAAGSASLATGGAAVGAGATGIATGVLAKAAAVTATVAVAGGVGYELAVAPAPEARAQARVAQRVDDPRSAVVRPVTSLAVASRAATGPLRNAKTARLDRKPTKSSPPAATLNEGKGKALGHTKTKARARKTMSSVEAPVVKLPPRKQAQPKKEKQPKPVRVERRPTKPAKPTPAAARERTKPKPAKPATSERTKPVRPVEPPPPQNAAKAEKPNPSEQAQGPAQS
jgi:RNA polymerase sigma factor (sigma-70 family)